MEEWQWLENEGSYIRGHRFQEPGPEWGLYTQSASGFVGRRIISMGIN